MKNAGFFVGTIAGLLLFSLIGAAVDPNVAHFPAISLNGKTNVISDSGTAPTWNGGAWPGGGGDTIWTNSAGVIFIVNASSPTNQTVEVADNSAGSSITNLIRLQPATWVAETSDSSGGSGTLQAYTFSNGGGDASIYGALDFDDSNVGLYLMSFDPTGQDLLGTRYLFRKWDTLGGGSSGDDIAWFLDGTNTVAKIQKDGSLSAGTTNQLIFGGVVSNATLTLITTNYWTITNNGQIYKVALVH